MKNAFGLLAATIALVAAAACNPAEENAAAPDGQGPAASNVAKGTATASDHGAIMKARHKHYEEMGDAMKAIGAQLKADAPSVPIIQQQAAIIAGYGPQILSWFPEGSGREAGRTRAKPEIWSDAATFRQRAQAFEAEAGRFNQAAQSGDLAAIRAAQGRLGETCKNCHDRFRYPEH